MLRWQGFEKIVRENEPLPMHTWLGVGGPAEFYAQPRDQEELSRLIIRANEENMPVRILGAGSNVLIRDEGIPGLVIHLNHPSFAGIHVEGECVVAGGGASLSRVVTTSVHEGLGGLEVLTAIPGTVGGAVRSNVGAHGGDIGQWVSSVTLMTHSGELVVRKKNEIVFGYRRSSLDDLVILEVRFELQAEDPRELARRLQKLWIVRRAAQPLGHQASVRVFRDPRGTSASELIEAAGLKGTRIGGAMISDRNANFIVAESGCTTADILRLIDLVRTQVSNRLGVVLELELEIW